jgi:Putative zinc-finger
MTHATEDQLIAYALGEAEAGTRAAVESHVAECAVCRGELDALGLALEAAAVVPVPERDADYGARVWAQLAPRLPAGTGGGTPAWRGWLAAAAVLALVVGAFLAGRWSREASPAGRMASRSIQANPVATGRRLIRERVMLAALGDHLDRTERAFVELVNADGTGAVDISAEQAWARDLLDANRLYRVSARGAAPPALTQLLDELEPVLLAIVHSPSRLSRAEFDALRSRIEDRSLVFKVRVSGADVRARQRTLLHSGDKTS